MLSVRRTAAAVALAAGTLGAAPANAALPMRFWIEWAGAGTVAFACHNVAATVGTNPQFGSATRVSCTFNGFPSARVFDGGWHATSAGLANAEVGSAVEVCVTASTVIGFPNMTYFSVTVCRVVVAGGAGTLFL